MAEPVRYEHFPGYEKYQDESGEWRWRLRDDNNRIIAESGEGYDSEANVDRAVENVIHKSGESLDKGE